MKLSHLALFLSAVSLLACSKASDTPLNPWAQQALSDLEEAHRMMQESHPGPKDQDNPGFKQQADDALSHAQKIARQADSSGGYGAALLAYTARFRDGHFGVYPTGNDGSDDMLWPSMLPGWRNDVVRIVHTETETAHLEGSEILSCDETEINALISKNVFQFDAAKPDQPAYWARRTPRLFAYSGNPAIERIKSCQFKLASGEIKTEPLNWVPAPDEIWGLFQSVGFGPTPEIGMNEIQPGIFWINMSDFSPNETQTAKMRDVFRRIRTRQSEIRNSHLVVIDMRGNQGGSSAWGHELIEALWGKEYAESRAVDYGMYAQWRLSQDNVDHMGWIVNYLTEKGHDEMAEKFQRVHEQSVSALAGGQDFYTQSSDDEPSQTAPKNHIDNPVNAPVFFLTHGVCASACLDMADAIFELEGITHIGYPTSSDTNYLEVRQQELSSGKAMMVIPTKVWRNRPRASGETYTPKHQYDGFDWSDKAIQAWTLGLDRD